MKKYLVIGNPIEHSLSPKLHNYWIKKNNIDAIYDKKQVNESDIKDIISDIKNEKINGINVTMPFKKSIIPFIDKLSFEANESQSVNTIYLESGKIIGHNTDIAGFELGLRHFKYDLKNKKVLILGAGGVVSSMILALNKMKVSKIILSNRTKKKAENLKKSFKDLDIVAWGNVPNFDMIINATSIGLKKEDEIKLNYSKIGPNKFFYDAIYNPQQTNFLKKAKEYGNKIGNGKMMFIYQARQAFTIWHKLLPEINDEIIKLLD
jgi:shikimate dehydrogenase